MLQLRSTQLLQEEITLRQSCQPFLRELLRLFLLALSFQNRDQLFSSAKIIRSGVHCELEIKLCLLWIALARRKLRQSQPRGSTKAGLTRGRFIGFTRFAVLPQPIVSNSQVVRNLCIRRVPGMHRLQIALRFFKTQEAGVESPFRFMQLKTFRKSP